MLDATTLQTGGRHPQHGAPPPGASGGAGGHGSHAGPSLAGGPGGAEDSTRILLDDLLDVALQSKASDLHLSAGSPPKMRVHGAMEAIEGHPPLTGDIIQRSVFAVLTSAQRDRFEAHNELDCSYTLYGKGRFRVNVMRQRGNVSAVFRVVPWEIKELAALGLPQRLSAFSALHRGLVLVTGPTGSGKSTTLAAIIDVANRTRRGHIVTIEDPIEFLFEHKGCVVNQREVGDDTASFAEALRHVLRQDPDIVVIGELRDLDTMSAALTAAETGHLVFGTLHTRTATEAVTRIIDAYPAGQQNQIRVQLAGSLQGVVAQELVRTADGLARTPAIEVLVATPAIRNIIRENKIAQLPGLLEAGAQHGMETMDQALARLVASGRVTMDDAKELCRDPESLEKLVRSSPEQRMAGAVGSAPSRLNDLPAF